VNSFELVYLFVALPMCGAYVFLFSWPKISRAYTCWYLIDHGWKLYEKEKKVMFDEKMGKVFKGGKKKEKEREKRKRKKKEKCSFVFLRFYVDEAWNQKKLSIGA